VLWNQWLDAKVYPKPPGLAYAKSRFFTSFQYVRFMDGH
jgi:hypothetical protein